MQVIYSLLNLLLLSMAKAIDLLLNLLLMVFRLSYMFLIPFLSMKILLLTRSVRCPLTNTEILKEYSSDFYPSKNDYLIAYCVLTFLRSEYVGKQFSNIDCSFSNLLRIIERYYDKVTI